ncbi:MAG TPA: MAPEG family protein [Methylotenera sp.]|nr:MAPEG family protein [Methylotenera sp.]
MHTSIYAGLCGLLMAWLALKTIKARRTRRVKLGDGGDFALQSAIRAQGNFAEYMPIVLILLFLLENNGAPALVIHVVGTAFLIGRWVHAQGLLTDNLRYRMRGMSITLAILIGMAVANIFLAAFHLLKNLV